MAQSSPKRIQKIAGKGEIARNEQLLFFSQYLQKTCAADSKTQGLVWERVKQSTSLTFYQMTKFRLSQIESICR